MEANNEDQKTIQNPRRQATVTMLEKILNGDDPNADILELTALGSIAINLAELTDKVAELTAYMQGFMEWTREPKN